MHTKSNEKENKGKGQQRKRTNYAKDKKGKFLVLDLEIEGISLISSHKAETMSILRKNKGDFNVLLGTFTKSE